MAKRFTDTNKYKKPFFRGLTGAYKLLWDYLYHDCDHAGIWIVDFEIAQLYLGKDMLVNKEQALKVFNSDEERIIELDQNKWFIPSFIKFQYGNLNPENNAHSGVIKILQPLNLIDSDFKVKGLISTLLGAKDMDKEKELDKEKEKEAKILKKDFSPLPENLIPAWELWLEHKPKKFKNENSEKIGRIHFLELTFGNPEMALKIVNQAISSGWMGLQPLKKQDQPVTQKSKQEQAIKSDTIVESKSIYQQKRESAGHL